MKVLFMTVSYMGDLGVRGIYTDLLRTFVKNGHSVYAVCPFERRMKRRTALAESGLESILGVRTLNIQKTSFIEKGVGTLLLEHQYMRALRKYLRDVEFDLVLYTTPPITLNRVIRYVKRQSGAKSYLLLKDIFPQNAVDLGLFSRWNPLYRMFRQKERALYRLSDRIGCMSPANVRYLLAHNPEIGPERVEVAANSIEVLERPAPDKRKCRRYFDLPTDKPVFLYGGNLGKPQGIEFLIRCMDANADRADCHFVIVGSGTELPKLQAWYASRRPASVTVLEGLPKNEYDKLVPGCDIGMIFLDHRFTIPNYPSRLLSYLENKMPVICATDPNTDIGTIAEENGYGYWCESNSTESFTALVDKMLSSDIGQMGERAFRFLQEHYSVERTYQTIVGNV